MSEEIKEEVEKEVKKTNKKTSKKKDDVSICLCVEKLPSAWKVSQGDKGCYSIDEVSNLYDIEIEKKNEVDGKEVIKKHKITVSQPQFERHFVKV